MSPAVADDDVGNLIEDLVQASKLAPKARQTSIKHVVARVTSAAYERGLLPGSPSMVTHFQIPLEPSSQHP